LPVNIAGNQRELDTVTAQLDAKQAVVDQYLADYEDNTIDRDTVTRRVGTTSTQIRQMRHRRDELMFLLDDESDEPDGCHLTQLRDRITQIIATGTTPERKALCDALIAELRLNGNATATPVFRVPLTGEDTLAILGTTTRTTEKQRFANVPYGAPPRTRTPNPRIKGPRGGHHPAAQNSKRGLGRWVIACEVRRPVRSGPHPAEVDGFGCCQRCCQPSA
jgi:hypothetical protein